MVWDSLNGNCILCLCLSVKSCGDSPSPSRQSGIYECYNLPVPAFMTKHVFQVDESFVCHGINPRRWCCLGHCKVLVWRRRDKCAAPSLFNEQLVFESFLVAQLSMD